MKASVLDCVDVNRLLSKALEYEVRMATGLADADRMVLTFGGARAGAHRWTVSGDEAAVRKVVNFLRQTCGMTDDAINKSFDPFNELEIEDDHGKITLFAFLLHVPKENG